MAKIVMDQRMVRKSERKSIGAVQQQGASDKKR